MLAALYAPGHFLGGPLARKGDGWVELILMRISASVAVAAPVLVALALAGLFTVPIIAGSLCVCAVGCRAIAGRLDGTAVGVRGGRWDLVVLGLVAGSLALYSRPAEYVINSRDPGVYTVAADRLARTGELLFRDPMAGAVSSFHTFLEGTKYPGFYILGENLISPQFFPGPFALLAAGNILGGTWGGLYVVPVFGALAVGMAFMLGRELFGKWAGLSGAALLAASYAQLWWARHPSSEVMTQFFVLAGLWLGARFLRHDDRLAGALAGLLLGGAMLTRVDGFLAAAAIPALFAHDFLTRRPLWRWLYPGVPLAVFAALVLVYLNTAGARYLYVIYAEHGLKEALALSPYLAAAAIPAIFGAWYVRARWEERLQAWLGARGRRLSLLAALAVAGVALWGYFVAPVPWESLPDGSREFDAYQSQILVRMVWFTTPAVAVLGLAGFLLAARRLDAPKTLLLGAFLGFGVLYAAIPNVAPDLPWATRRFVPVVLPGLCLLAGYAAVEAGCWISRTWDRRAGTAVGVALIAASLGWTVHTTWPILRFQELDGAVAQFAEIEREVPPSRVLFMEMPYGYDVAASTFEYAYGHPVLPYTEGHFLSEKDELREAGLLRDAVYVTTDGGPAPLAADVEFREVGEGRLDVPRLAPVEKELPTGKERLDIEFRIFTMEPEE